MSISSSTTSSSPKRYSIVEPHPSVPSSHYLSTGRGGAGNVTRAPPSTTRGVDASGPAARLNLVHHQSSSSHPRRQFVAGRGGAGNVHPSSERAIFSFDEELERQLSQERHAAPVYHVGRGGAGNLATSNNGVSTTSSTVPTASLFSGNAGRPSTTTTGSNRGWYDGGYYDTTATAGAAGTAARRRSSDHSFTSHSSTGSESGADVFNRGIKKRWNKLMGVGYYMT
ncbi:uncharacterized protein PV06_04635 [Exophiala oligosperma]|uniref:Uncharacterized protein n=1 Tax=Exophiala oligosperma TaxID=215243 RepID=A0A0D2E6Y0_9EURO|nr:uncharacterized protein PV06_04635 [Exophiala oligosperma]KIW43544.1 hypothetical protein PV06_04635 [Exophiala oligosperma]